MRLLDLPTGAVIRQQRGIVNGKISSFADFAWERKNLVLFNLSRVCFVFLTRLVSVMVFRNQLWGIT